MEDLIDESIRDSERLPLAEESIDLRIGARIRQAREEQGESLRALAQRCGVSASMLSDVERGAKSPTISTLSAIAEGLEVPLSLLVSAEQTLADGPRVLRASDVIDVIDPQSGVRRAHLGALAAESKVEFLRFILPAGTSSGGFTAHADGTIERVYVAAGRLEITIAGKLFVLEPGDTVVYRAAVTHALRAAGNEAVTAFLVIERP